MRILSTLLVMYIVTGMLLFVMAFLLYQFQLEEVFVEVGVMVIYVAASLLGGFVLNRRMKAPCGYWGLLLGSVYFLVLLIGSMLMNGGFPKEWLKLLSVWLMCGCASMLGGMFRLEKPLK